MENKNLLFTSINNKYYIDVTVGYVSASKMDFYGYRTRGGNYCGSISPNNIEGNVITDLYNSTSEDSNFTMFNTETLLSCTSVNITRLDTGKTINLSLLATSDGEDAIDWQCYDTLFSSADKNKVIKVMIELLGGGGLNSFSCCKSFTKEDLQ